MSKIRSLSHRACHHTKKHLCTSVPNNLFHMKRNVATVQHRGCLIDGACCGLGLSGTRLESTLCASDSLLIVLLGSVLRKNFKFDTTGGVSTVRALLAL